MKKAGALFLVSLLVSGILLFIPDAAYSIYFGKGATKQAEQEFAPQRLIVKLKPEVDQKVVMGEVGGIVTTGLAAFDQLNVRFSVGKQEKLFKDFRETALKSENLSSVYILKVPEETDLEQMKTEYETLPQVEYVELDHMVEVFDAPNDPLFENQWHLNNTGQGYLGVNRIPGNFNDTQIIKYGTVDADIDALEAFQRDDETTIPLVGIIDTGVDLDHVDLAENIWTNSGEIPNNDVDDDHNGFVDDFYGWDFSGDSASIIPAGDNDPTDYYGHGTHCAGIVASVRDNGIGVSGITSPCNIMAIKIFPNAFFSVAAKSIIYASDMGCDVINMSWGSPFPSKLIEDALDYATSKGILPVAAAGNSGKEENFYPASVAQVFTVGASNSSDEVTYFSTYGDHIEVVAPGEDILSLRADSTDMYAEGGASGKEPVIHIVDEKYYLCDGTSMASPCAVGVAAYIIAASPGITNQRVIEIIQESADDILDPYGEGENLPGWDIYSGYGRVNLNSALQLLSGRLAKIDYPYHNTEVSGDIAIIGTASGDSFQTYILEYGEGYSPESWIEINSSSNPVSKDTLGIWNSSGLTGRYTLRLTVGEQNQAIVHVIVNNDILVEITSPAEGDTVQGMVKVYGSSVLPDFSHYTLESGAGESPSEWDTIITSTKIIADDILGNWLISFLENTNHTLRLSVETNAGQTYADSVMVFVKSISSGGWVQQLSSWGSLSPAVGDVDGDGYDEVVVGIGSPEDRDIHGGIEVFSHEGVREVGWPKDTAMNMMSSPALGDLDNDGIDDIVICSDRGYGIFAYTSSSSDWVRAAGTGGAPLWSFATPVIADLENDGHLEVLMINNAGVVHAWRNDGQSVIPDSNGVFAQANSAGGFPSLAVADLDRDGKNEVIAGTACMSGYPGYYTGHGGIYIWDIGGNPLLDPEDYSDKFGYVFGMAIANIDENDDFEIIVFGANEEYFTLSAFKKDGTQIANYPIILEDLEAAWGFGNHPAIGDLEGDGILEIVVSTWTIGEARIYAWHEDGTPLGSLGSGLLVSMKSPDGEKKREVLSSLGNNTIEVLTVLKNMSEEDRNALFSAYEQDPIFASVPETFGTPILADVNGDNNVDIITRAGYNLSGGYERVFAWDYEGNLIPGFPLYASAEPAMLNYVPYSPVMADVDKDGKLNMVLATDDPDFELICWEFDTDYSSIYASWHRCWPKYMHDKWNSGLFEKQPFSGYTIAFVVYLINYIFRGGLPPVPFEFGDVNCDAKVDILDVVYLINYLFKGGPPPCP